MRDVGDSNSHFLDARHRDDPFSVERQPNASTRLRVPLQIFRMMPLSVCFVDYCRTTIQLISCSAIPMTTNPKEAGATTKPTVAVRRITRTISLATPRGPSISIAVELGMIRYHITGFSARHL
jgi:hypothetical protein